MFETRHSQLANGYSVGKSRVWSFLALFLLLGLIGLTACGAAPNAAQPNSQNTTAVSLKISTPPAQALLGVAYNAVLTVSGGSGRYSFRISSGSLPPGLALNPSTGSITGMPSVAGTYSFVTSVSSLGIQLFSASSPAQIVVSANQNTKPILSISPSSATVPSQGQQQFTAQTTQSANTGVTWSTSVGTISTSGAFTAPKVTANTTATITAVSDGNSSSRAEATVTITPQVALAISNSTLPAGNAGAPYSATLSATGGVTPYRWNLTSGSLPSGILLQASSGTITGISVLAGSYPFTAKVTDASGNSATLAFTLSFSSSSANGFDGPAELPRIYIQTAMSNTPAPGSTVTVNAGGDLQSALNSASCGDTIQLQAGATFNGVFTFPAKSCDDNHWIIVRSSANDSALPPEGSRLTPCYAGVLSLPSRPALHCSSTKNVLAKLVMAHTGSGPIVFAAGANHYRLIGLEITRLAGIGEVTALSSLASDATANNLIFDRVWMHGTAQDETTRGVALGGSTYVSIVDSFFTDFHCVAKTGACIDAQTVVGGLGSDPMGPYKIVDNFLEASGENILFGGGTATVTPADIEITHNHMFKPLTWMQGQAGYVGGTDGHPFIVKNFFELKNGQRVLFEGNILENTWGGFSQAGFAILLTPKNQAADTGNVCPNCQVTDVTIRYVTITHVGGGMQLGNGRSDKGGVPLAGNRYSIHDLTADDIDAVKYNGLGTFAQVSMGEGSPVLHDVTINHVTAFQPEVMLYLGDDTSVNPQMNNFVFTNNIINVGSAPTETVGGGTTNCAYYSAPLMSLGRCFRSYIFTHNAFIASPVNYPPTKFPSGNYFPSTASAVDFVNYSNGMGGDYHLQSVSPYKNAGTDGKDLGADIDAIQAAIAGVE